MVSGMLTAIRDFAHDSFRVSEDEALETLQVGDVTVWIEQGPYAILAAVIRGTAPRELRTALQEALEYVHAYHGDALRERSAATRRPSRRCVRRSRRLLQAQYRRTREAGLAADLGWHRAIVVLVAGDLAGVRAAGARAMERIHRCAPGASPGSSWSRPSDVAADASSPACATRWRAIRVTPRRTSARPRKRDRAAGSSTRRSIRSWCCGGRGRSSGRRRA